MLKISNLTKKYGDKCAVDDLSLEIRRGEICAFIGHNGAGKTTTLKAAMGILSFDAGEILIDGISVSEDPIKAKSVAAYIPDNPELYDYLSGAKYLSFVSDVYGVSTSERKRIIDLYADKLGIKNDLSTPIGSYSHGMKQKVAVISALIHDPKLLVLDEPFVGLDPKAAFILKEIMREMCRNGAAIFFSTHVLDVAEKLCNKVAIIRHGRIIAAGTMEELTAGHSLEEAFLEADHE
jgi:ABC-2 type transport system ATP-binding protein